MRKPRTPCPNTATHSGKDLRLQTVWVPPGGVIVVVVVAAVVYTFCCRCRARQLQSLKPGKQDERHGSMSENVPHRTTLGRVVSQTGSLFQFEISSEIYIRLQSADRGGGGGGG